MGPGGLRVAAHVWPFLLFLYILLGLKDGKIKEREVWEWPKSSHLVNPTTIQIHVHKICPHCKRQREWAVWHGSTFDLKKRSTLGIKLGQYFHWCFWNSKFVNDKRNFVIWRILSHWGWDGQPHAYWLIQTLARLLCVLARTLCFWVSLGSGQLTLVLCVL